MSGHEFSAKSTPYFWLKTFLILLCSARLLSLALYPVMDTTEARYAGIAHRILETGDWIMPQFSLGVPFWGKPPLSFWASALSMNILGWNEFAARLPHWILGMVLLGVIWRLARRYSPGKEIFAVSILASTALFYITAGTVVTDMALVLCTTLAMGGFWNALHGRENERRREAYVFFAALGVGLLAKGPIVLVLSGLPIALWCLYNRRLAEVLRALPWVSGTLLMLAIALPWYAIAENHSPGFLQYFIVGEHWHRFVTPGWQGDLYGRGHHYPHGLIWIFALAAALPWSIVLPFMAWRNYRFAFPQPQLAGWHSYLIFWSLSPCLFFTLAGNILWTYVLPGLPALALLTASVMKGDKTETRLTMGSLALMIAALAAFLIYMSNPGISANRSDKILVERYKRINDAGMPLVYVQTPAFSAEFYLQQAPLTATSTSALNALMEQPVFLAVRGNFPEWIPDSLRARFTPVDHVGPYRLYRSGASSE